MKQLRQMVKIRLQPKLRQRDVQVVVKQLQQLQGLVDHPRSELKSLQSDGRLPRLKLQPMRMVRKCAVHLHVDGLGVHLHNLQIGLVMDVQLSGHLLYEKILRPNLNSQNPKRPKAQRHVVVGAAALD